jgi:hypothetical protein
MAGLEPARAFTAQRILSPLRLPFRHIGAVRHKFKRFMRPAKMNFVVATHPALEGTLSCKNAKLTVLSH